MVKGDTSPHLSAYRGSASTAGTMQLGLLTLVVVFLSSMDYSDSLKIPRGRRQRHSESSYIGLTLACSFTSGLSLCVSCLVFNSDLMCITSMTDREGVFFFFFLKYYLANYNKDNIR